MPGFLYIIAGPAINQVTEKSFLRKPFVRIGGLFGVIGYWVFQEGGILGYAFRDKPTLLWKLVTQTGSPNQNKAEIIKEFTGLNEPTASASKELKDEEQTFFHLYTMRELRSIGINLNQWPPDKKIKNKADVKFADVVMRLAFVKGIEFGFNLPEQFKIYWENTYKMRPYNEWEEMRKRGIVTSDKQQERTLNEAIIEIAENAIVWSAGDTPIKLDNNDIKALESLIYQYKSP